MNLQIGELVMHETAGVCRVEKETRLEGLPGDYYVLCPLYLKDATFYTPKDGGKVKVRPVMTREDARMLIEHLPEVEPAQLNGVTERKQTCTEILKSGDCYRLASLAKSIYQYQQSRLRAGKKLGTMESGVLKKVELLLYGELATALELQLAEVEGYIIRQLEDV